MTTAPEQPNPAQQQPAWPPQPQQQTSAPPYMYGGPVLPPGPARYPPQPLRTKKPFWSSTAGAFTIVGIVLGGLLLIGVVVVAFQVAADRQAAKDMDVKVTGCRIETTLLPTATVDLSVTNTGSRARGATVHLEYRDTRGELIDTDTSRFGTIQPGDTARKQEVTFLDADPGPTGTCKVVGVS